MRCLVLLVASLCVGCAAPREAGPVMPPPADFHITLSAEVHLTPQLTAESGLPATVILKLDVSAKSEASGVSPLQSQHERHLTLTATDESGKQSLAHVQTDLSGCGLTDRWIVRSHPSVFRCRFVAESRVAAAESVGDGIAG